MDQVKRGPGRPPKIRAELSQEPVTEYHREREVVEPERQADVLLFTLPIPEALSTSAIAIDSLATMPADIRWALEGRLGCIFTMSGGEVTAQDGRHMRLVVCQDEIEVFEL